MITLKKDFAQLWDGLKPRHVINGLVQINPDRNETVPVEGTTGFFRYLDLIDGYIDYLFQANLPHDPKILFAPCSVGCVPYSFVMRAIDRELYKKYPGLEVHAQDINPAFIALMEEGLYPELYQLPPAVGTKYDKHFTMETHDGKSYRRVNEDIRQKVTILPAQDLAQYAPGDMYYDVVTTINLFLHFEMGSLRNTRKHKQEILNAALRMTQVLCTQDLVVENFRAAFKAVSGEFSPLSPDLNILPPLRFSDEDDMNNRMIAACFHHENLHETTWIYRNKPKALKQKGARILTLDAA